MIRFYFQKYSVMIRDPELGDSVDLALNMTKVHDMKGRPHTWITPNTSKMLTLVFKALSRSKVLEIRQFLIRTSGNRITYEDVEGELWTGRMTTNPSVLTAEGRGCMNTITLVFEGNKNA